MRSLPFPGPALRAVEGELVRITLDNRLPAPTTIHWHGVPVPNAMDGVPDVTQPSVVPDGSFVYEFVAGPSGTYFYHSHVGLQLDRGLLGSLVVERKSDDPEVSRARSDRDVCESLTPTVRLWIPWTWTRSRSAWASATTSSSKACFQARGGWWRGPVGDSGGGGRGTLVGLVAAAAAGRLLSNELPGVGALDPLTLGVTAAVLLAAALTASYLPARRAAKVDPLKALRTE